MHDDQIAIWEDPDVRVIFDYQSLQPLMKMSMLGEPDHALVIRFVNADSQAHDQAPAADFIAACIAGVAAFENLSHEAPIGFRKFLVHQVALNTSIMWNRFGNGRETRVFADWVMATLSANGWNPDGGTTPLGQRATWNMGVAAQSGGGVRRNPRTGRFETPDGQDARMVALAGSFEDRPCLSSPRERRADPSSEETEPPRRRWFGRR